MFDKIYLIYLGIGVVIVLVAFFAYQELQKHKMEIQKLRYESQKLQKIIHAYNMRQWHQDPSEEQNETDSEEDSDNESNEIPEVRVPAHASASTPHEVQEILNETLSTLAAKGIPQNNTIPNEQQQPVLEVPPQMIPQRNPVQVVQRATIPISPQEPLDDLPEVDSFAVQDEQPQITSITEEQEPDQDFEEKQTPEIFEEEPEVKENENEEELCNEILKTGPREGEQCGYKAKVAGKCMRHYKSMTSN